MEENQNQHNQFNWGPPNGQSQHPQQQFSQGRRGHWRPRGNYNNQNRNRGSRNYHQKGRNRNWGNRGHHQGRKTNWRPRSHHQGQANPRPPVLDTTIPYRISILGCLHGKLTDVYKEMEAKDQETGQKTKLMIIGGDFQAIRNTDDLKTIAIPKKYLKETGDFYEYYSHKKKAPVLTIVISGNHEASHYMRELYYGGWLAPNIYFLGASQMINVHLQGRSLRIYGCSGIFKQYSFYRAHPPLPFDQNTKRGCYHVRQLELLRALLLEGNTKDRHCVDIGLSHDWPRGSERYGNYDYLISKKPFFEDDIAKGKFGNPMATSILNHLSPTRWFSGHCHVHYYAEWDSRTKTKFQAVDKCNQKRNFLKFGNLFEEEIPRENQEEDVEDIETQGNEEEELVTQPEQNAELVQPAEEDKQNETPNQPEPVNQNQQQEPTQTVSTNQEEPQLEQQESNQRPEGNQPHLAENNSLSEATISLDLEWIAVLKATERLLYDGLESLGDGTGIFRYDYNTTSYLLTKNGEEVVEQLRKLKDQEFELLKVKHNPGSALLKIPEFQQSAPPGVPNPVDIDDSEPKQFKINPQTKELLKKFGFLSFKYKHILFNFEENLGKRDENSEEIDLDLDDEDDSGNSKKESDVDVDAIEYAKKPEHKIEVCLDEIADNFKA